MHPIIGLLVVGRTVRALEKLTWIVVCRGGMSKKYLITFPFCFIVLFFTFSSSKLWNTFEVLTLVLFTLALLLSVCVGTEWVQKRCKKS